MDTSAQNNDTAGGGVSKASQAGRAGASTGQLLTRSFLMVGALILIGGVIAVWQIAVMRESAQRLYEVEQPAFAILLTHSDFQRFQAELQILAEMHDESQFATRANTLADAFNRDIDRAARAIQSLPPGPERDKQLSSLDAIRTLFSSEMSSLTDLAKAGDWNGVRARVQVRDPVTAALSEALVRDIDELVAEQKKEELEEIQRAGSRAALTLLASGLATLLIAGMLGWRVRRIIGGRLEQLDQAARALGRGEFQHRVRIGGSDEIGRLARVFNEMSDKLSNLYEALSRSEAQFRSLIENASDFILVLDADGVIRYASPSFQRTAGVGLLANGRKLLDFVDGSDDQINLKGLLEQAKATPTPVVAQFRIRRQDGGLRMLEASASNLLDDTAVKGIVVNARDTTERKSLEEQLIRAQRMEAIGTLSGGIAHDFNNILTVILGYTEQLRGQLGRTPALQKQVERIDEASRRAAALTRQLLAFSRKQVLQPKVFNLNSLILDLDKMLRRMIGEHIELQTATDARLGAIKADPSQIEQVVMNLVLNARDAMPNGGKVTIETARANLDDGYVRDHMGSSAGPHVMLAVSDSGEGIAPDILPHIFEPFFTTKEVGKGTGLGLSTVYGIVKQSGGHIWVYSEPGRGTTFKVYFPIVAETPEATAEPVRPAITTGNETVLLVEDEPALRELIETILRGNGFRVLAAPNPATALTLSRTHKNLLHLLLTDVVMPEMSGPELARQLQQERPHLKVLYMSGYASQFMLHRGTLEPGTQLLEKPFHPQTLLRRVREVLDYKNGNEPG